LHRSIGEIDLVADEDCGDLAEVGVVFEVFEPV
jgi:hypothetical protein